MPLVAKVREALRNEYMGPPLRSFKALFPYLAHYREIARTLSFEGQYSASQGKWDDALEYELDAMRMGSDMCTSEGSWGTAAGMGCVGIGRSHAWNIVDNVSASAAKRGAKLIQAVDAGLPAYAELLRKQELSDQASMIDEFRDPHWRSEATKSAQFYRPPGFAELSDTEAWLQITSISPETVMTDYTSSMNESIPFRRAVVSGVFKRPGSKAAGGHRERDGAGQQPI